MYRGDRDRGVAGIDVRAPELPGRSGRSSRGGQNTLRSPTIRGMPLTSSGAIWVPSSDRHGRPISCAAW